VKLNKLDQRHGTRAFAAFALMRSYPMSSTPRRVRNMQNAHYFANTEGSKLRLPEKISTCASGPRARASDGTELWHASTIIWRTPARSLREEFDGGDRASGARAHSYGSRRRRGRLLGPVLFEGKARRSCSLRFGGATSS
jgi:hypothetical protein